MAKFREYDCCDCPQGCIHCGKDKGFIVYQCDLCYEKSTDRDFLEEVNGQELCSSCIDKMYE